MNYSYGRSGGFLSSIPPIVKNLIIINALIFLATQIGTFETPMFRYLALYYPESPFFMPHQPFTHMFMHGGFFHLFFNMYALWIFGTPLERTWGSKKFLLFYMATGIGAALIYCGVQWIQMMSYESSMAPELLSQMKSSVSESGFIENVMHNRGGIRAPLEAHDWLRAMITPMVGASSAIFGVLLGFGMLSPNVILQLIFPPVRLKAKYFVIIYGALELYLSIQQPGDSVAHVAHVGGMIFGFILIKLWQKKRMNRYWN
ncbi:MAG: rhomboid family intramembrane serine protease [Prevotellaceae bacterium]|jgi:membrane associated rhomboid family serine protease|nr:rhomboid family intramembrane serine protease [Prevotellaceae bacterium]